MFGPDRPWTMVLDTQFSFLLPVYAATATPVQSNMTANYGYNLGLMISYIGEPGLVRSEWTRAGIGAIGPWASWSKKTNSALGEYEERCYDGKVRSNRGDEPCALRTDPHPDGNFNRERAFGIPAGPGYLLVSGTPPVGETYAVELQFANPVAIGPRISADLPTVVRLEAFEAPYMDIEVCGWHRASVGAPVFPTTVFGWCGTVINGAYTMSFQAGSTAYFHMSAQSARAFLQVCVSGAGAPETGCLLSESAPGSTGLWFIADHMGPINGDVIISLHAASVSNATTALTYGERFLAGFHVEGFYGTLDLPAGHPLGHLTPKDLEGNGTALDDVSAP